MEMNKKGIAPALLIPLAIGIVILVLGIGSFIGILASTKLRILAGGATIVVLTIVYGLQGEFNKTKAKFMTILIIIGVAMMVLSSVSFVPQQVLGSQPLSLSQVNLQSTNPFFSGKAWLLSFSAGGLGQSYSGTVTPSQVDAITPDGTRTTKTMSIDVTYDTQECQYPISIGTNIPIRKLTYSTYTSNVLYNTCNIETAKSKGYTTNLVGVYKASGSLNCYVIQYNSEYPVGNLGAGNVNAPYTINLNIDGQSSSLKINPLTGLTSGPIGNIAYAQWAGSLVSGVSCPSTTGYFGSYVNGQWRIINDNYYGSYKSAYNSGIQLTFLGTGTEIINAVNNINKLADSSLTSASFGTISDSASQNGAIVKVPLSTPLQFPVTALYVKADTLGIYTPVPNIEITSVSSPIFKTGSNGYIQVGVKNTGSEQGTFSASASCNDPFAATGNYNGALSAGASATFKIPISAATTAHDSDSCTITILSTGKTVTKTVTVTVDPIATCLVVNPTKFCEGNTIYQCSVDGVTKNLIQTCASGEKCSAGACVKDTGLIGDIIDGLTPDANDNIIGSETPEQIACNAKSGGLMGYTWVKTTTPPTIWKQIATFGTAKPTVSGYCYASNAPYFVTGIVIIILGVTTLVIFKPNKRRKK